jgi:hypothetical protein
VAHTVGQASNGLVAAETEVRGARIADWPAALFFSQLKQRTAVSIIDGLFFALRLGHRAQRPKDPMRISAPNLRTALSLRKPSAVPFGARKIEAGYFANDGVAAYPNVVSNFTTRKPSFKTAFQQLNAFTSPRGVACKHVYGPKV